MVNLELRKAALEASGWKFVKVKSDAPGGFSWRVGEHAPDFGITDRTLDLILPRLPAVESDPGVSESWFLAWCDKERWDWTLQNTSRGYRVMLLAMPHKPAPHQLKYEIYGDSLSEARAKAVVEAGRKK